MSVNLVAMLWLLRTYPLQRIRALASRFKQWTVPAFRRHVTILSITFHTIFSMIPTFTISYCGFYISEIGLVSLACHNFLQFKYISDRKEFKCDARIGLQWRNLSVFMKVVPALTVLKHVNRSPLFVFSSSISSDRLKCSKKLGVVKFVS
jgi:hypothetical protein